MNDYTVEVSTHTRKQRQRWEDFKDAIYAAFVVFFVLTATGKLTGASQTLVHVFAVIAWNLWCARIFMHFYVKKFVYEQ